MSDLLPSSSDVDPDADAADEPSAPRVVGVDSDDAEALLSALSSDTARRILATLHEEPAPPSRIAERVDTSLQNVQYHVDRLEAAGVVEAADTVYSEKGREMTVYGPAHSAFVVVAGPESESEGLSTALSQLLGGVGVLAVGSVVVDRLVRRGLAPPFLPATGGSDGGGSGAAGDPGGTATDAPGGAAGASDDANATAAETTAEATRTATPAPTEAEADDAATATEPAGTADPTPVPDTPAATETPAVTEPATETPAVTGTPTPTPTVTEPATETPAATPTGTPAPTPTPTPEAATATETVAVGTAADPTALAPLASPGVLFFLGGLTVLFAWVLLASVRE
jgi:DNA-binding transcriptional ArsR family regulator